MSERGMQDVTVVAGGTGKTGRRVARRLEARGGAVRVASRAGAPPFRWEAPETWDAVLRGARAVYLAYAPDVAAPGAAEALGAFAARAAAGGARRLVLLSGRGEEQAVATEEAVRASGARVTVLRSAFLFQNFSEGLLLDGVRAGEVAFPAGDVGEPFVDAEDVADVAVAALTGDGLPEAVYELTGPRLLTFGAAVAEIADAAGRAIRWVPLTKAAYAAALAPLLPPEEVAFLSDLLERVLDGRNAHVSAGVERALGRRPRDLRAWARDVAATGAWRP